MRWLYNFQHYCNVFITYLKYLLCELQKNANKFKSMLLHNTRYKMEAQLASSILANCRCAETPVSQANGFIKLSSNCNVTFLAS